MTTEAPAAWIPNAPAMKRVIAHWTAGAHRANSIDLSHYHILVEGNGNLVRGTHSIADNVSTADGRYAAHTLGANTGSIGVAMCCMAGCRESPFRAGRYPATEVQWEALCRLIAQLCRRYGITVTKQTVLGHGEVQRLLGIPQRGKWDPLVLPFDLSMNKTEVGDYLRARVRWYLEGRDEEAEETPAALRVVIGGTAFADALMLNEGSYVALRPVAESLGWSVLSAEGGKAKVDVGRGGGSQVLRLSLHADTGYVSCREVAGMLDKSAAWDAVTRTVTIS